MTEREALLRAVCEHPEDDLPRLVFADFLDDAGEADRAEFVRLQVELGRHPITVADRLRNAGVWLVADLLAWDALRRRERALFDGHARAWFDGDWWGDTAVVELGAASPPPFGVNVGVARGFVSSAAMSLADFLRHAPALFAHPVTKVAVSDREPWESQAVSDDWAWWRASAWDERGADGNGSNLPDGLFDLIADLYPDSRQIWGGPPSNQHLSFPTRDAALDALSAACVAHGRRLAGLSPLPAPVPA